MDFLNKLTYLTKEDIENNDLTLKAIEKICPFLHQYNPLTYKVFMKYRSNLTNDEIEYFTEIIKRLEYNENLKIEEALKRFE